jgi:23S rRNA pseudouridine1911/1915/1917 synthase
MTKKQAYQILYEDDHLVVVDKAAGIPVVPERKAGQQLPLIELLRQKIDPDINLVHRIDKDTSGVMLFAKTLKSQQSLSLAFQDGKIEKLYLALVTGRVVQQEWQSINYPIFKKVNSFKVSIHPKGKKAKTSFRMLEQFQTASLLEVKIFTGRTHQIRIHLAHHGHPLLVDPLYGTKSEFYLSELKGKKYRTKKDQEERPILARQSLHAFQIGFMHPISGKKMEFKAQIPKDLRALLQQLRKVE